MREAVFLALEEVMIQTYGAEKPSNLLDRLRTRLVTKPDRGLVYIYTVF